VGGEAGGEGGGGVGGAGRGEFDVVVLDIMMPRLSGTEVCRRLRAESIVPIIMLTAKDAEVDRVLRLELGADDYVTKPFSSRELASRIRAVPRRVHPEPPARWVVGGGAGGGRVGPRCHRVESAGEGGRVTPAEFKVAAALAAEPNRVFSRWQIMERLWDAPYVGTARAADVHVSNLRRKI